VNCRESTGLKAADYGGAISSTASSPTLERLTIIEGMAQTGGGGIYCSGGGPVIRNCTIVGCSAPQGAGIYAAAGTQLTVEGTIIASSMQGEAVWCDEVSAAGLTCSDLFGNAGGDWVGCLADQAATGGNFSLDPLFCDAGGLDFSLAAMSPCAAHPGCGRVGALGVGCGEEDVPGPVTVPSAFRLGPARPNPFGPRTTIAYDLPKPSRVRLMIYDVAGRVVRTLVNDDRPAGSLTAVWDGRDDAGRALPKGVYFYEMRAGGFQSQRRMTLL
jgi:hypothetical protein